MPGLGRIFSAIMGMRVTVKGALPAVQQGASERASTHRPTHRVAVGVLMAVTAAAYSVFALLRYYTFQTASYDLVIFDQAVRSYAHFRPGISIIKGVHNGYGPDFSVLGDHWSPILAALAPLYWIRGSPQTLLVAQAVLFALAIPPLWIFTRRAFGGGGKATAAAYLVSASYALSWPIASAVGFDFHEVAFAPVLTAVALERLQAGRLRTALIALAALLLVKEDMGFFVAGIGIYLAVSRPRTVRRQLLVGLALVVGGIHVHRVRDLCPDPGIRRARRLLLGVPGPRQQRPAGRRAHDHPPDQLPAAAHHAAGQARHHALAARAVLLPLAVVAHRAGRDPAPA